MNLLARREHSEKELLQKLKLRGFDQPTIQTTIATLSQEKLLSNPRFVENYIHFRCNKGFGPLRIQAELFERGILTESIEHHLKITDTIWFTKAREVWEKRFKSQPPTDLKSRAQQIRFLQYRGFSIEHIDALF